MIVKKFKHFYLNCPEMTYKESTLSDVAVSLSYKGHFGKNMMPELQNWYSAAFDVTIRE